MSFEELQLVSPILKALAQCNHHHPTPVQVETIPKALAGGDVIASAQTGTGKTAAFILPTLQRMGARPVEGHDNGAGRPSGDDGRQTALYILSTIESGAMVSQPFIACCSAINL